MNRLFVLGLFVVILGISVGVSGDECSIDRKKLFDFIRTSTHELAVEHAQFIIAAREANEALYERMDLLDMELARRISFYVDEETIQKSKLVPGEEPNTMVNVSEGCGCIPEGYIPKHEWEASTRNCFSEPNNKMCIPEGYISEQEWEASKNTPLPDGSRRYIPGEFDFYSFGEGRTYTQIAKNRCKRVFGQSLDGSDLAACTDLIAHIVTQCILRNKEDRMETSLCVDNYPRIQDFMDVFGKEGVNKLLNSI